MAPKWSLLLLLLLLSNCPWARPDAPSVCYNFTISTYEYTWCEFGVQVNGKAFLQYACSQKAKCNCYILSTTSQATETCNGEEESPKTLTEELKKILLDMTDLHTLKGEMTCQREGNGHAYGIWYFYLNGNKALHFDSKNGNRTVLSPEGALLNNALNNDKDVIGFLLKNPTEMCKRWYEKMRNHQDEELNTTDPPTTAPATAHSKATTVTSTIWTLLVVLTCQIMFGITG